MRQFRVTPFSHPDFARNQARAGKITPCCICGKGIKNLGNAWMVHVSTANEFIAPGATVAPEDDMGWFPVGPDCLRKHPELKEYACA